jgi:hypothetical protein
MRLLNYFKNALSTTCFDRHCSSIYLSIDQWLYSPFVGLWPLFQFLNPIQSLGHLGRVISQSQGRYLHTDIHAFSGIRTHDPSVRASEDSSCLRPRGHCDRLWSSSRVLKNCSVETAVLAFFPSNVECVVPPHIRVFHGAACLLLPRCVFTPGIKVLIN